MKEKEWTKASKTFYLPSLDSYLEEIRKGWTKKGIREILPECIRHFYIFHRIEPHVDVPSMIENNRYLFYQIPYSEIINNDKNDWINKILKVTNNHFDQKSESARWKYPLSGNNDCEFHNINSALTMTEFNIKFADTFAVQKLLARATVGTKSFDEFQKNYQNKEIKPFVQKSISPEKYSKKLFELEKILYGDVLNKRYLIRQYPLFHLGIWFGILVIVIKNRKISKRYRFDSRVAAFLPWISQKMYSFVFEKRFSSNFSERGDAWIVDQLSRIAATAGMNVAKAESTTRTITFSRTKGEETTAPEYNRNIWIANKLWSTYFNTSDRKNAFLMNAISEVEETAGEIHLRNEHARRAAGAAILSRNFSHHIGSHVMPRATVNEVNVRLNSFYNNPNDYWKLQGVERLKTRLDEFIQRKADFLAEVSTDPSSSSETKRLGQDVIAPFIRNALLMDNLARNEGFGYLDKDECTLKISLCISDGKDCKKLLVSSPPSYDPVFGMDVDGANAVSIYGVDSALANDDPFIAVPGMQGQYALYGILENLIRNAAKHGRNEETTESKTPSVLHIHLHIEDDGEDYYKVRVWDNRTDPAIKKTAAIPGIDDGAAMTRYIANHLQAWMESDLIDPSGEVRREGWGVAETVICANLLAGKTDYAYDPNVSGVKEEVPPNENGGDEVVCESGSVEEKPGRAKRVVFTLRLLKAKKAIFIGECFEKIWSDNGTLADLRKAGIRVVKSLKKFIEIVSSTSRIAYPFAVIDEASSEWATLSPEEKQYIRVALPFRVFRIRANCDIPDGGRSGDKTNDWMLPDNPFSNMNGGVTPDRLVKKLWELWLFALQKRQGLNRTIATVVNLDTVSEKIYKEWTTAISLVNRESKYIKMYIQAKKENPDNRAEQNIRFPDENIPESKSALRVGFDRHGHLDLGRLAPDDCYEEFHKRSPDFDPIYSAARPLNAGALWELPFSLAEAGLLRILVIDERMAERALRLYSGDNETKAKICDMPNGVTAVMPCFWHLAWRAKIFIATHLGVGNEQEVNGARSNAVPLHKDYAKAENEHNTDKNRTCPRLEINITKEGLKPASFDQYGKKWATSQNVQNGNLMPSFDVVLIHQGVLDTYNPKEEKSDTLREWIKKSHPWMVIESGRGIPPEIQKKPIRFLAYSVLDQALIPDGVGKLLLTRRLMALPRFVSEKLNGENSYDQ